MAIFLTNLTLSYSNSITIQGKFKEDISNLCLFGADFSIVIINANIYINIYICNIYI